MCEAITEPATLQLGGTLGEGDSREFVGLRTGDDLLITFFDFAGLWVSYGSIRAHGIYPGKPDRNGNVEDPRVLLEIFDQSERIGAAATQHLGLTSTEQGAEALGILIVLESERPISELLGNTVTLRGEITDACGNTATDELDLVVACAPDDDHCKGQQ